MAFKTFNFNFPYGGEPIDLTVLSEMAGYLNEINQALLEQKSALSSLEAPARLKVETDNVTIWTGKILVQQNILPVSNPTAMPAINWSVGFDVSFRSIPVVTATPYSPGGTVASNSCWLYEITQTGCKGKFRFIESPEKAQDIYVMITAIGEGVVV